MGTSSADFSPVSDVRTEQTFEVSNSSTPLLNFDEMDVVLSSPIKAKIENMKAKMKLKRKDKSIRQTDLHIQKQKS